MKDLKSMRDVWNKLMYILTPHQKRYGILLFLMSIVGALFETLGVSIIIPFMQAMMQPEQLRENHLIGSFLDFFGIVNSFGTIIFMCICVCMVYLIKNIYLIILSWVRAKYSCKIMRELSVKVMRSYMKRPYSFFLKTNIGDLTRGTSSDAAGVYSVISYGFHIIAEVLTVACVFVFIVYTDAIMALSIIVLGVLCMILMQIYYREKMRKMGDQTRKYNSLQGKYMYQAYEGIKEVLVMQRQDFFVKNYENAIIEMQRASVGLTVASESPSYVIEAICVIGIIMSVGLRISGMDDPTAYIPSLASFAMAAFRIMPSLGRITSASNNFIFYCPTLTATYDNLHEVAAREKEIEDAGNIKQTENSKVKFKEQVLLNHISWKYDGTDENVIDDLNLKIKKGMSIGIIGASGAGKSTLMDIILGLLPPQNGKIMIDEVDIHEIPKAWSSVIGYVPQSVYLTDDNIRNNVAFGLSEDEIDEAKIWRALKAAQIDDFVKTLPDGLNTSVGERGIRFSGGQRQRVAIARALYYDPDILVFDEATSALDNETEAAVMESIDHLHGSKTLIIVAHRLSTIRGCDEIYEVCNGKAIIQNKEKILEKK